MALQKLQRNIWGDPGHASPSLESLMAETAVSADLPLPGLTVTTKNVTNRQEDGERMADLRIIPRRVGSLDLH